MNETDEHNGIGVMFGGDTDDQRRLRAALAVTARRTGDPELAALIRDVLHGRRDVLEVFNHPTFNAMAARSLDNLQAGVELLDDETRAVVFDPDRPRTPDAELDAVRDAWTPGAAEAVRVDAEGGDPDLPHLR